MYTYINIRIKIRLKMKEFKKMGVICNRVIGSFFMLLNINKL